MEASLLGAWEHFTKCPFTWNLIYLQFTDKEESLALGSKLFIDLVTVKCADTEAASWSTSCKLFTWGWMYCTKVPCCEQNKKHFHHRRRTFKVCSLFTWVFIWQKRSFSCPIFIVNVCLLLTEFITTEPGRFTTAKGFNCLYLAIEWRVQGVQSEKYESRSLPGHLIQKRITIQPQTNSPLICQFIANISNGYQSIPFLPLCHPFADQPPNPVSFASRHKMLDTICTEQWTQLTLRPVMLRSFILFSDVCLDLRFWQSVHMMV